MRHNNQQTARRAALQCVSTLSVFNCGLSSHTQLRWVRRVSGSKHAFDTYIPNSPSAQGAALSRIQLLGYCERCSVHSAGLSIVSNSSICTIGRPTLTRPTAMPCGLGQKNTTCCLCIRCMVGEATWHAKPLHQVQRPAEAVVLTTNCTVVQGQAKAHGAVCCEKEPAFA